MYLSFDSLKQELSFGILRDKEHLNDKYKTP